MNFACFCMNFDEAKVFCFFFDQWILTSYILYGLE